MRLAHFVRAVFPQHGYGGIERHATALTRHLLLLDVDVTLCTRVLPPGEPFSVPANAPGRLTVRTASYGRLPLRHNGIPARLTNYRTFVEGLGKRVRAMALRGYIDGIYAQGLCAWGVRSAAEWGVPLVVNPQGMEEFKIRQPLKRLAYAPFRAWVRAGSRAADRVIATDSANRHEVPALLGVPESKVAVIPNGIDIQQARAQVSPAVQAELRARWPHLGWGDEAIKGVSVGRLEANKGFEYLLRALAGLSATITAPWAWMLVGEGSLRPGLEQFAAELGLADRVSFAGRVTDSELHNLYALSNLFVHPTLFEGSSLVTIEAMAHRLPVVASAVGGIPDKVVPGETGFLVPPANPAALAEKIAWMAVHPTERRQMGERGGELAERVFSAEQMARMTADLFAQLLDAKLPCRDQEA